jgi:hypothetical protein
MPASSGAVFKSGAPSRGAMVSMSLHPLYGASQRGCVGANGAMHPATHAGLLGSGAMLATSIAVFKSGAPSRGVIVSLSLHPS